MAKPFFPTTAKKVVPILQWEDDEGLTVVQAAKNGGEGKRFRFRMLRLSFGRLLNATMVDIDGESVMVERHSRAAHGELFHK